MKQHLTRARLVALLLALAMIAAACGGSDDEVDTAAETDQSETVDGDAMDDEAMEDDAMEDDAMEEAMDDDAMEDESMEDAMDDEAMDDMAPAVELAFEGLEPLGDGFVYEGWVIVDGTPVSTGRFSLADDGSQIHHTGALADDLTTATAFVLTIEPAEGDDPAPADAHVLAGDFVDGTAALTVGHPAALGNDFSEAGGEFVLATPTSAATDDELSGIWFIRLSPTRAGLDLPTLPAGWVYEGWAVVDGQPITTGRFTSAEGADDFNGFSGDDGTGPAYPGEDFIQNAPDGLTFPLDLTGSTVVVSIEPEDDDSPAPFAFKPLAATVPEGIGDHEAIILGAGPAFPTGTAALG